MKRVVIFFTLLFMAFAVGAGLTFYFVRPMGTPNPVVKQTLGRSRPSNGVQPTTGQPNQEGGTPDRPSSLTVQTDPKPVSEPGAIADAAARIEPSVVTIETEYRPEVPYDSEDPMASARAMQSIPRGTGSGVIFSADGIIVTNNHVVDKATRITVTLSDGREVAGKVLGTDALTDLAVIKVDQTGLPPVVLANSDTTRVGEWAIAVGNPLHVGVTVTAGIVSAIRKNQATGAGTAYATLIQTDAAINPGNSGGALADIQGRLIGINSAIASTNGGNVGIGYAIPSNTVRDVVSQLVEIGRVRRTWLGVATGVLNDRGREQLHLTNASGSLVVVGVQPTSPADKAGIQKGDVILAINDHDVKTPTDLQAIMQGLKIDDTANIHVWRNGQDQTVTATLTERPANLH